MLTEHSPVDRRIVHHLISSHLIQLASLYAVLVHYVTFDIRCAWFLATVYAAQFPFTRRASQASSLTICASATLSVSIFEGDVLPHGIIRSSSKLFCDLEPVPSHARSANWSIEIATLDLSHSSSKIPSFLEREDQVGRPNALAWWGVAPGCSSWHLPADLRRST